MHEISRAIPAGAGKEGAAAARAPPRSTGVLAVGPRVLVDELGIGTEDDLEHTESGGCLRRRRPGCGLRARARRAARGQLGTIGSGNHFIELQRVDRVFDAAAAAGVRARARAR